MTFTITPVDSLNRTLTIELNKEDLNRYIKEAEDALGQDIHIDGFRKGKAPREELRKRLGEASIRESALQIAMERSVGQILAEQDLDIAEVGQLTIKENSADKFIYTVNIRTYPVVTLPDLTKVSVERQTTTIESKEIDDALELIRSARSTMAEKDGPATTGDRVEVDFEVKESGQLIDGGSSKNHPIVIGKNNFIPGFEEQLVGMKKGEHKDFSLIAPADFINKTIAGKKLDMSVTLQDIQSVTLPTLDDNFAQSAGKFKNLDELKASIKEGLLQEKKEKENDRVRMAAIDQIVKSSNYEVSDQMIDAQLEMMLKNFDQDLHRHDMELSLYLAKANKTQEDLRKEWREDARRQVATTIVLRALARQNNIEASEAEVNEALESFVQSAMLRGEGGQAPNINVPLLRDNIHSRLLTEKTLQYIDKMCIRPTGN